jgi:hypothetical protein
VRLYRLADGAGQWRLGEGLGILATPRTRDHGRYLRYDYAPLAPPY